MVRLAEVVRNARGYPGVTSRVDFGVFAGNPDDKKLLKISTWNQSRIADEYPVV